MTFVKAYEELWDSRCMKQLMPNIQSFPTERLETEVNRSWKLERNLHSEAPIPVHYHFLSTSSNPLLDYISDGGAHLVQGNYLFIRKDQKLHCMVYLPSGHPKTIWSSEKLSLGEDSQTRIRSTTYVEGGREISTIIADGLNSF